jgi:hypothetical protein
MSDNASNPPRYLTEAVSRLRACQPLAERLVLSGVTIELSEEDRVHLLNFEQLVLADYSESEWSYLRVVSGVKAMGVASLHSCLTRYRATTDEKQIYGQL